jgi:hypothetical protein
MLLLLCNAGEFEAAARGQGDGGNHGVGISFGGAATMVASSIGHVKLPGRKKGGRNDPQENEAQVMLRSYNTQYCSVPTAYTWITFPRLRSYVFSTRWRHVVCILREV